MYRAFSRPTYVDTSLFGETQAQKMKSAKMNAGTSRTLASAGRRLSSGTSLYDENDRGFSTVSRRMAPPTLLSTRQLRNMQKQSIIMSAEDIRRQQEEEEKIRLEKQQRAEARKERMRALESNRLANLPKSFLEQQEEKERQEILARAAREMNERDDDMKRVNSLMNYAITVAIRERQLEEKKERAEKEKLRERMEALDMEVTTMRAAHMADREEQERRETRRAAARGMLTQLEEARLRKQRERMELKEEQKRRQKEAELALAEERAIKEEQMRQHKQALDEILLANEMNLQAKRERILEEREMEAKADRELLELAARKEAELQAQEQLRREKERRQHIAAGITTKLQDDREAQDLLRERRAYEAGLRADREAQLARAKKAAEVRADLERSRALQLQEKQRKLILSMEEERREWLDALDAQEEWSRRATIEFQEEQRRKEELRKELEKQIQGKRRSAAEERERTRREERDKRVQEAENFERLRRLRDERVAQLKELGVASTFTTELSRYDPEVRMHKKEMEYKAKLPPVKPAVTDKPQWRVTDRIR